MPWIVGGAALAGGALSNLGANNASKEQGRSTTAAIGESQRQYDVSRADLGPYRDAGSAAITRIRDLLGIPVQTGNYANRSLVDVSGGRPAPVAELYSADPAYRKAWDDFANVHQRMFNSGYTNQSDPLVIENEVRSRLPADSAQPSQTSSMSVADIMAMDPGYQFRYDQGLRSARNVAGARGMLNSGQTLKGLTEYGQGVASQEFNNIYNRLANVAGLGQGAVNTGVGVGANTAGNVGNLLTGVGNARGAAAIGGTNAWSNAFNTVGNYFGQQNALDKILNRGGYTGSSWLNANAPS